MKKNKPSFKLNYIYIIFSKVSMRFFHGFGHFFKMLRSLIPALSLSTILEIEQTIESWWFSDLSTDMYVEKVSRSAALQTWFVESINFGERLVIYNCVSRPIFSTMLSYR